jgi:hypothetical protein
MVMTKEEVLEVFKTCRSKTQAGSELKRSGSVINKLIEKYDIDISHFGYKRPLKWEKINKECPVCGKEFEAQKGHPREKMTCSYACSNSHFRSGKDNPNFKNGKYNYRTICFLYHEKKCVICGEDKIVGVHHLNEDHQDNRPENLIPLCPTHHSYWHSNYKSEIEQRVLDYIEVWKENTDLPS